MEEEALRLRHQVCFALYAASRAVTSRYRPILDRLGLTYPQYVALLVLWERGEALATICQEWLDGARRRLDAAMESDGD